METMAWGCPFKFQGKTKCHEDIPILLPDELIVLSGGSFRHEDKEKGVDTDMQTHEGVCIPGEHFSLR